ncbi:MAG: hypothetical protein K2H29_05520 [Oscillospiraceae bacterium]|nr:hypothetical protein [Oscillospiraceae bacterium]
MKEKSFKQWCTEHKELIILVTTFISLIAMYLFCKKYNIFDKQLIEKDIFIPDPLDTDINYALETEVDNYDKTESKISHVSSYIRKTPKGKHPSTKKKEQAAALGISLGENETLVNEHERTYHTHL